MQAGKRASKREHKVNETIAELEALVDAARQYSATPLEQPAPEATGATDSPPGGGDKASARAIEPEESEPRIKEKGPELRTEPTGPELRIGSPAIPRREPRLTDVVVKGLREATCDIEDLIAANRAAYVELFGPNGLPVRAGASSPPSPATADRYLEGTMAGLRGSINDLHAVLQALLPRI